MNIIISYYAMIYPRFVDMMWYKAFSVWLTLRLGVNVLFQVRASQGAHVRTERVNGMKRINCIKLYLLII